MEFPDLGKNCSDKHCNKLDFLPMKCDVCKNNFCNEHFKYAQHGCVVAAERDVQVPACPLCGAPVPGRRGEAPDVAVSAHIDSDCKADRSKVYTKRCSHRGCRAREMIEVVCAECGLNFCLRHRYSDAHSCQGKLGAKRRQAEEAALLRARQAQAQTRAVTLQAQVQGQMSEDEALARALQLSMQQEQRQPLSQRAGGEQHNGKCSVS